MFHLSFFSPLLQSGTETNLIGIVIVGLQTIAGYKQLLGKSVICKNVFSNTYYRFCTIFQRFYVHTKILKHSGVELAILNIWGAKKNDTNLERLLCITFWSWIELRSF